MTSPVAPDSPTKTERLITKRAVGVAATIPLVTLLAWWLGYPSLGILAAGAFLLLLGAAALIARPPTARLERSVEPSQVTRGEPATVRLTRRNRSPVPAAQLEAVDRIGHLSVEVTIPLARPGASSEATYRFVTSRRGHLAIGPAALSRRDPWGLYRRSRQVGGTGELLVLPRVLPIAAPELVSRLGREAGAADIAAGSDRFHTLREYVVGDELRKVHWPTSARTGRLVVKQMVDSPQPRLLLFLDCKSDAYRDPEAFEQAVDMTASLGHAIAATGIPVTVAAGPATALEVTRSEQLPKLLETLAVVTLQAREMSSEGLRTITLRSRATAIVAVTGNGNSLLTSLTSVRSIVGEVAVYRLGADCPPATIRRRGLIVHDARTADEMATLVHTGRGPVTA